MRDAFPAAAQAQGSGQTAARDGAEEEGNGSIDGVFYRIVTASDVLRVLDGAKSPEGRFHHSGMPALYLSSSVEKALKAIEAYRRPDDASRVAVPLQVTDAAVVDLRDTVQCAALGITAADADVPWRPQRQAGVKADSWQPADLVRESGADGMIYTARTASERWHVVLFRWNATGRAKVSVCGPAIPIADQC